MWQIVIALLLLCLTAACIVFAVETMSKIKTKAIADRILSNELAKTFAREQAQISEVKELTDADKTPTSKEIQDALRRLRDRGHSES